MLDITTAGSYVSIDGIGKITRFSDDADPWQVEELECTGYGVTINGELLVWAKPCAYVVTVNVLSGTSEAKKLSELCKKSRVAPTQGQAGTFSAAAARVKNLTICLMASELAAKGVNYTFTNGRLLKGSTAPGANSDGRTTSIAYTFVFEDFSA